MPKFQPGQSGNPLGRPKEFGDLRALARERTEMALQTLESICKNPDASDGARVLAAVALLDRGYGKPAQSLTLEASPMPDYTDPQARRELARKLAYIFEDGKIPGLTFDAGSSNAA